jgi:hypothetical protein
MKKKEDMYYEDDRPITFPYYWKDIPSDEFDIMVAHEEAIAAILFKYSPRNDIPRHPKLMY